MAGDKGQAAIFLDRDGTINEDPGYIDRLEKFVLIPGAAEAIRLINNRGLKAIVVTNQSGVARGFFDEAFIAALHAHLAGLLRREGAFLDGFYYCPHHPTEGRGQYLRACDCRKPAPGLLIRAQQELGLDPARCCMIGDTLNDIEAGRRAGVDGILVRTGHGEEALATLSVPGRNGPADTAAVRPIHIAENLLEAVRWILKKDQP
jgi:D,D-heptose 1,7-bisphosphate phosphatase